MRTKPFLVITRAGGNSLHPAWLEGGERNFDLLVTEYAPSAAMATSHGIETIRVEGTKIAGYHAVLTARPELFSRYTHIALLDDDILLACDQINRCFEIGGRHQLQLWQPSLSWDSYLSYAATLHVPGLTLRYTNYVEMMCPFFASSLLQQALPLFSLGYETGIDMIWSRLQKNNLYRYAIIDAVIAKHTKRVGLMKKNQGFSDDYRYEDEMEKMLTKFNTRFRGPVTYGAILANGKAMKGRGVVFAYTLALLLAVARNPQKRFVLARILDHWRHILTRPVNACPITLDSTMLERAKIRRS